MSTTRSAEAKGNDAKAKRPGLFTRIALFYRQVVAELRKVIWPTRTQLITYTIVVIIFTTVFAAIVAGLDLSFGQLMFKIFG